MPGTTPARRLTLAEVAERLGVHYMTAYGYVRDGRLEARKDGTSWSVDVRDLEAFDQRGRTAAPPPASDLSPRFLERLLRADEEGAWRVVQQARDRGTTPAHVLTDLVAPAAGDRRRPVGPRRDDGGPGAPRVRDGDADHRPPVATARPARPAVGARGDRRRTERRPRPPVRPRARPAAQPGAGRHRPRRQRAGPRLGRHRGGRLASAGSPARRRRPVRHDRRARPAGAGARSLSIRAASDVPIVVGGHGITSSRAARDLGADHYTRSAVEAVALLDALAESGG